MLHGPNLNLLGQREPQRYGRVTLSEIDDRLATRAVASGAVVDCRQSNHEGVLVDWIQQAPGSFDGVLINPAGYTHTSVAIRDALLAAALPAVEVHLTNVYARELFRHQSLLADMVVGRVMGFGAHGYCIALEGLLEHLRDVVTPESG